jgi:hypothetical protein
MDLVSQFHLSEADRREQSRWRLSESKAFFSSDLGVKFTVKT